MTGTNLICHPIEPDCKITPFDDWRNDIWDKVDVDGKGAFYQGANFIQENYILP